MQDYKDVLSEILIDAETLQNASRNLGTQISADYQMKTCCSFASCAAVCPFMVDLSRHITTPHMMDFMAVSSYGAGKRESTGSARVTLDLQTDIRDQKRCAR
jgi:hypoxanthine phosphoribosyltransferase